MPLKKRLSTVVFLMLAWSLAAGAGMLWSPWSSAGDKSAAAKHARPKIAVLTDGTDKGLALLRETLKKVPAVKASVGDIKYSDFRRDGGLFVEPFAIEMTDLTTTDIGSLARALESKKPAVYLFIKYQPDSIKTKELQAALAKVKGVLSDKSWAGDHNIWVSVDASGQARLGDITRAMHGAGVKFRDPITDTEP